MLSFWSSSCNCLCSLTCGFYSSFGNGHRCRFWLDAWIPGLQALKDTPGVTIPSWGENFSVAAYVDNSRWRWEIISELIPNHICDLLASVVPPSPSADEDYLAWAREIRELWSVVVSDYAWARFFASGIQTWLEFNLTDQSIGNNDLAVGFNGRYQPISGIISTNSRRGVNVGMAFGGKAMGKNVESDEWLSG
ncbi:hypothetical protein RIF29_14906 [Crotalaria pallida]|uniref:Uncharacterized protein n=1 Tax=Crotalaria pallida TaxID=3830 RepID=A0AAN9FCI0_CROPI